MRRTAWGPRVIIAACVITSGYIHWRLWQTGMRNVQIVGPAFLVNAAGGVVIGLLVLLWRHRIPMFLAFGFGVATLGAFVLATSSFGLFGVHSRWQGTYEWTAAITEAIAIVLGAAALLAERRRAPRRQV